MITYFITLKSLQNRISVSEVVVATYVKCDQSEVNHGIYISGNVYKLQKDLMLWRSHVQGEVEQE